MFVDKAFTKKTNKTNLKTFWQNFELTLYYLFVHDINTMR
jgi:hypothetical protein